MRIETRQLGDLLSLLLAHLEKHGAAAIEIPWDYYWDMPEGDLYNPYESPTNLDMGQLSDDWEKLQKIARGDAPPVGEALVWLAAVLRAMGQASRC